MTANMFRSAFRTSGNPLLRSSVRAPVFTSRSLAIARRYLSDETRSIIQQAVTSTPVVLFMKGTPEEPRCGFSRATIQVLGLHGVPSEKLKTFDILEDQELRSGIKEFSEWPTIPQLYVDGEFVGGCDILLSMHQSGELEELLEKKGIIPPVAEETQQPTSGST